MIRSNKNQDKYALPSGVSPEARQLAHLALDVMVEGQLPPRRRGLRGALDTVRAARARHEGKRVVRELIAARDFMGEVAFSTPNRSVGTATVNVTSEPEGVSVWVREEGSLPYSRFGRTQYEAAVETDLAGTGIEQATIDREVTGVAQGSARVLEVVTAAEARFSQVRHAVTSGALAVRDTVLPEELQPLIGAGASR